MPTLARSASEGSAARGQRSEVGGQGTTADSHFADLIERLTDRIAARDRAAVESILAANPGQADRLRRLLPTLEVLAALDSSPRRVAVSAARSVPFPTPETRAGETPTLRIGDYEILREIGRGGMGIVYEAEQLSLRRRVALKVLPLAALLDERLLQRFKNEAQAAAGLTHPNIVPIYAVGCEQGIHYYAMQYIDGQSLAEVIEELRGQETGDRKQETGAREGEAPAEPEQTLRPSDGSAGASPSRTLNLKLGTWNSAERFPRIAELGIQAAEALHYAHERGIIHRDIKPGNLLLDQTGKLWITDFGLAAIEGSPQLTMTGDLIGTLRYMSPEQALGIRMDVDCRTDIYSLGATLFELLTLKPFVSGESRGEIFQQLAMNRQPCVRKFNRAVPAPLEDVVLKAVSKHPHQRYVTPLELAEDLQRFLDGRPVKARRAGHVFPSRSNKLAASSLAVIAGLVVCGWFASVTYSNTSRHAIQIQREEATTAQVKDNDRARDVANPQVPIPAPPGLVAWWSGDGDAQDSIGGNHGTLEGGAGFGQGMVGQAFNLDGIDDYVRVPHHILLDTLTELTIECWIHCIDIHGPRVIISKWSDSMHDRSFIFKDANDHDRLHFELEESPNKGLLCLLGKSRTPKGNWAHVAATYDGNVARVYLDGVEENHHIVEPTRYLCSSRADLIIGANDVSPSDIRECFRGLIDDLSLYSRALGPEEILSIYRAGSAGKIKPPREH